MNINKYKLKRTSLFLNEKVGHIRNFKLVTLTCMSMGWKNDGLQEAKK